MKNEGMNSSKIGRGLLVIAWNEWSEGSYLEPEKLYGMKYLEAVKKVIKR